MPATARDLERLQGVHPKLVSIVVSILNKLPMFVVQGLRTAEYQHSLWLQGRPGGPSGTKIVTMKDGYIHKSNHQAHEDGLGWAVDCAWTTGDPFGDTQPWETYGQLVEVAGCTWGGRWSHPHDSPHCELKP